MRQLLGGVFFLSISLFFLGRVYALESEKDWSKLDLSETQEFQQKEIHSKRSSELRALMVGKHYLLAGNIEMARFFFERVSDKNQKLYLVKKRYLSLLSFIEGDYNKSLDLLKDHRFNDVAYYSEICLLKILNMMTLKSNDKELEREITSCSLQTERYSSNNQLWLDALTQIKFQSDRAFKGGVLTDARYLLDSNEMARTWLKTGLFINREDLILENISYFTQDIFRSQKVRELIGLAYYRMGNKDQALSFVEDIDSPNAENIKGNINLERKEYELAFGHFKLALKQKENSLNALERSVPLSWILGLWEDGRDLLKRLIEKHIDPKRKLALDTAFLIRQNKFEQAQGQLNLLHKDFKEKVPLEIDLMNSYVAIRLSNRDNLGRSSAQACRRFDGLNCWIQLQEFLWDNLGKTIKREEDIYAQNEWTLDKLKEPASITPLEEIPHIDQRDIEELDSQQIQINP